MATRDFTKQRAAIEFTIAPDTFRATPAIPAGVMIDAAAKMADLEKATAVEQLAAYRDVLEMCLEPGSFALFEQRMQDRVNPIDLPQVMDVVMWLFEEYGLRPTTPSESSSDSPSDPGTGTTSMDELPRVELISASSLSTVS